MLQAMRSGSKSPVMKVFLVFLAGGFALWGVGDVTTGLIGGSDRAISAGDESLSPGQVAVEFDRTRRNYLPNATIGEAMQAGLLNELAGVLSRDVVFRAEANHLGLTVTREMQRDAVIREPAFLDELGSFSEGRFLQTLAGAGLDEATYLNKVDTTLRREQLVSAVSAGVNQPRAVSEILSAYELEKRTAKLVSVAVTPENISAPDTATLATWYESVKSSYDAPVLRSAKVGSLSPAMLMNGLSVSEDEVIAAFESRMDEFVTPETRALRQMVFDDSGAAQSALERINSGQAFNDVAADVLGWTADDVNLGTVAKSALDSSIGDAAFAAEPGTVVGPVESIFGHHLLLVDEINEGSEANLDEVRDIIEMALRNEAAIDAIYDRVSEMEDKVASGATLQEAITAVGGEVTVLKDIDRNGRDIDGNIVSGDAGTLAQDSVVLDLIWNGDIDEMSVIQEGADDTFYLVEVTGEEDSRPRDLNEVRDRATNDWVRGEAIKAAREQAVALAADTKSFDDASQTNGFRRNGIGLDHEAARLIANIVFATQVGETDIVETGNEAIAVMTTSVIDADVEELANTQKLVTNVISASLEQDVVNILALHLSQKHDLQFNLGPVQQLLVGSRQ